MSALPETTKQFIPLSLFMLNKQPAGLVVNDNLVWGQTTGKRYTWNISMFDWLEALATTNKKSITFEPVEWENRISCLYLEDYRIAGGKPWGGGSSIAKITLPLSQLTAACPDLGLKLKDRKCLINKLNKQATELEARLKLKYASHQFYVCPQPAFNRIALGTTDSSMVIPDGAWSPFVSRYQK